jgi:acyl-CoA hydrolase
MEVYLKVLGEDLQTQTKYLSNEAYFTFVALNTDSSPCKVPELIPETDEEKEKYNGALRRRQLRLILGGKMKVDDAVELKALFVKD